MVRFLFGQGWMIGWHLAFYMIILVGVVLPIVSFFPLKSPGEKPDLPSLGSFGLVMMIVCAIAIVTLIDCAILCATANGPWFHKTVLVIAAATVISAGFYWLSATVAEKQSLVPMLALIAASVLVVVLNLVVLHMARNGGDALSIRFPMPVLLVLIALSLPVVILALLVPLGLIFERFQR